MKIQILSILLLMTLFAKAQDSYSYITDRMFKDPTDLIGYNFNPSFMEIPDEREYEIMPGEYSFGISRNNLYVAGEGIQGVYSINNINPTEYGFKLLLMNARNPMLQGHLKVILKGSGQVEALVFKKSNDDKEMIFFLPEQPEQQREKEMAYFTDRWEAVIPSPDSLWGKTYRPFIRIHEDLQGEQERLQAEDSTTISFVETITVIEKEKKKKKKKSKDKDADENNISNIELGLSDDEITQRAEAEAASPPDSLAMAATDSLDYEIKKKVKIVKEYFVNIHSILTFEDGTVESKTWSYPIKKITEREDEAAGPGEERYQVEIQVDKGNPIYLYLTPERSISAVEAGGKRYLMQGH